ncbi:MAG: NUDIX domain-containing protein, partial [Blastocatellia bacterium]|nr:NUDIX domain-containing protein [Blastocatellia bacterium]
MSTRVALITAYNDKGELLLGRRNDNDKWTVPGGHLDEGEAPADGARRELKEETGLDPDTISPVTTFVTKTGLNIFVFSAFVTGTPHGRDDPDGECEEWKFYPTDSLPKKLHGPKGDENVLEQLFARNDILTKAEPQQSEHAELDEHGQRFKTGHPVTVNFVRNTQSSPKAPPGDPYQQRIEPHGRYMTHRPDVVSPLPKGWEGGSVQFKNPLVIPFNPSNEGRYDSTSWKARLANTHGVTGRALSQRLASLGHDGIVTIGSHKGRPETSEIVDLTSFHKLVVKAESVLGKAVLDPSLGYKFDVRHNNLGASGSYTTVKVRPPKPLYAGHEVASAEFYHHPDGESLVPNSVWVSDDHQGQGIASAMYSQAEDHTQKTIIPSTNQTPAGQSLWAGNAAAPQFGA